MKVLFTTGALFGALAVVLGAFGAHKLKLSLSADQLQTFETGVRYQFYHVFAIFITVALYAKYPSSGFLLSGWLFVAGIALFSGSVYLLACKDLLSLGSATKFIGPVTPLGGLMFIAGWILLAWNGWKHL